MSAISGLLRRDLVGYSGYQSARSEKADGLVWLNANESADASGIDGTGAVRRYPEPQPVQLRSALAGLYGCDADQVLIGRGSDEPIDLLVRASCAPGEDAVLVTPPVFGMYATAARLQGARLVEVPLVDGADDFGVDIGAIEAIAQSHNAKLVFLCSPGNPAGAVVARDDILRLARALDGRSLVVVDEAYIEYSTARSVAPLVSMQPNLAVLRTLSKAHALAGARIGCLLGHRDLIAALRVLQAPYPIAEPSAKMALGALTPHGIAQTQARIVRARRGRAMLREGLSSLPGITRVYPSQANFLLVRFDDPQAAMQRLLAAGIVVRDMRQHPQLGNALRISVGTEDQNTQVLRALGGGMAP
jgi:histidinol-phosphate aminotransferase